MGIITTKGSVKPSKNAVILTFQASWAGEIDICGLLVVSENYWQLRRTEILGYPTQIYLCVGTNQDIRFENGIEVLNSIKVTSPAQDTVAHYVQQFPVKSYPNGKRELNVLAGFGEWGFLDNLSDEPSNE